MKSQGLVQELVLSGELVLAQAEGMNLQNSLENGWVKIGSGDC